MFRTVALQAPILNIRGITSLFVIVFRAHIICIVPLAQATPKPLPLISLVLEHTHSVPSCLLKQAIDILDRTCPALLLEKSGVPLAGIERHSCLARKLAMEKRAANGLNEK